MAVIQIVLVAEPRNRVTMNILYFLLRSLLIMEFISKIMEGSMSKVYDFLNLKSLSAAENMVNLVWLQRNVILPKKARVAVN